MTQSNSACNSWTTLV